MLRGQGKKLEKSKIKITLAKRHEHFFVNIPLHTCEEPKKSWVNQVYAATEAIASGATSN